LNVQPFEPRPILAAFERNYVPYVLIGGLARVIRGADEITAGVDICPSLRAEALQALQTALEELEARNGKPAVIDEQTFAEKPVHAYRTRHGELKVIAEPAGTRRGYEDLRMGATYEPLGQGLRPRVASVGDLARMAAALAREKDIARLPELRRMMELEVTLQRELGLEIDL
jgi:hypothetical protein